MRFGIVFLSLCCYLFASPTNKCVGIEEFSDTQKEIIAYAYNYGQKYNFGSTLAAIAWHESCAGEYRINFADPSAGIYHALIPGVIKRYRMLNDTGFNRNIIGTQLIKDDEFASKVAIDELLYWNKTRDGNWKDIIKSYNKGFSWEKNEKMNELAENYYKSIKAKKDILEKWIPNNINNIALKEREPMLTDFSNTTNTALKNQEIAVIEKIRKIEVGTLKNDDIDTIKNAKKNNKAVISIYKDDDNGITHEKTITLKPFYVNQ